MAAHVLGLILRLRATLLVGAFRTDPIPLVARVVGLILATASVAVLCTRVSALAALPPAQVATATTLAGAAVVLAFALGPLLLGEDDPLDPRRFRTLGAEPGPLAGALAVAAVVSVPSALVLAYDVTTAALWIGQGANAAIAIAAAVAHALTCILLARVAMALRAAFLGATDAHSLAGGVVLAALLAIVPAAIVLAPTTPGAVPVARTLAFTPFGAAAALPGLAARGDVPTAWGAALVGAASLLIVGGLWYALVRRLLTTVEHPVVARGEAGLGWFALLPANATGAIAARSLLYWLRDSRYLANLAVIPIAGILPVVPLLVAGVPFALAVLVPIPLMALFYGWLAHNDLAYDSSALWLHIASGVRGVADRTGRLAPVLVVAVPVLTAATLLALALSDQWRLLPAAAGATIALLLAGLGLSSISSVVAPYAVSQPGDGPFQQPQRTGATGAWSQALVLLGAAALGVPTIWLSGAAVADPAVSAWPALWTGLGTGVIVLLAGIAVGAAVFERRGTRLMEFAGAS